MRYLLVLPIIAYTIGDTFRLALNLGPGLSLRNGAVYLVGLFLALRMVIRRGYRFELPIIHACFAILIGYAVLSMLVAGLIIRYDDYDIVVSAVTLKTNLIDNAIIFGLFFYGTQTVKDGLFVTKAIVAAVTISNIICIASVQGYISISGVPTTPEQGGRVTGAFGHPNETAALVAAVIPAYVAIARSSGGVLRFVWMAAGVVSSIAMLFMTSSRAAFLGILIGYPCATYALRRYVSLRQVLLWSGALVALGAVVLSLMGTSFVALFLERVVTESSASDVGALSSGRSAVWAAALAKMTAAPWALITGFGWNAWDFYFATHNQYLLVWFELGLVGLCTFMFLFVRTLSTVLSSVDRASPLSRGYLMAFVFGFGAFLIALFFGNMYQPWVYIWAYAGVTLRMALLAVEAKTSTPASTAGGRKKRVELRDRVVVAGSSALRGLVHI